VRIERELPADTLYRLVRGKRPGDAGPPRDVMPAPERIPPAARAPLPPPGRPARPPAPPVAPRPSAGAVAGRVAGAALPDAALRQALLETLDVDARVARVADAIEMLVRELKGDRS